MLRLTKVQHHYGLTNAFQRVLSDKAYCKIVFESASFSEAVQFLTNPYYKVLAYFMILMQVCYKKQNNKNLKLILKGQVLINQLIYLINFNIYHFNQL